MRSRQKALLVADIAREKEAEDIVILDMRKLSNITDFFIITTSSSTKRAQTIAQAIEKKLLEVREPVCNIEGYQEAEWILIDAYDIVAHVFNSELRRFYNLEGLWGDAPRISSCQKKRKKHLKRALKGK